MKNILSLRARDPTLAAFLEGVTPSAVLDVLTSRAGDPVPAVRREGRAAALHSLFDPRREAARLASAALAEASPPAERAGGYIFCEGLGGGFQVRHILEKWSPAYVLVVDCDTSFLCELFSLLDLSDILADHRVHLLVDPTPAQTAAHVRSTYLPGVMGGFYSLPLRSRIDMRPDFFESRRSAVRDALEETANDYTVQTEFGRLWTRNILTNLPYVELARTEPPQVGEAIVTSAGPSLEDRMDELARLRPERFLIATDTSLPLLLFHGVVPDAVLTIDCQYLSYFHFLAGIPSAATLAAELAAPPGILQHARRVLAVSSGHPLSRLAAIETGGILPIDTSGGNVGHAAVSLAFGLGATSVYLLGSDFAYPFGKPYARGTYLFDYFAERERRVSPVEAGMAGLIYRNEAVDRERIAGGLRYTTQTLRAYRDRFISTFADRAESIHPIVANGLPLDFAPSAHRGAASRGQQQIRRDPALPPRRGVKRFLEDYRDAVLALPSGVPTPQRPAQSEDSMDPWNIFASLYPLIARLRKTTGEGADTESLIATAKSTVSAMIARVVRRWYS